MNFRKVRGCEKSALFPPYYITSSEKEEYVRINISALSVFACVLKTPHLFFIIESLYREDNGKTDTKVTFLILLCRISLLFIAIFDIILLGDVYVFFQQAGCNRYSATKGRVFPKRKNL